MLLDKKEFTYIIYHELYNKVGKGEIEPWKKYNLFNNKKPVTYEEFEYVFTFYFLLDYKELDDYIGFESLDKRLEQDGIREEMIAAFKKFDFVKLTENQKPETVDNSILNNIESFISNIRLSNIDNKKDFINILLNRYKDLKNYKIDYRLYEDYNIFIIIKDNKIQRIMIYNNRLLFIIINPDSKQLHIYQYIYKNVELKDDDNKILKDVLIQYNLDDKNYVYFDIPLFLFQEKYKDNIKTDLFVILYFIFIPQTREEKLFIFGNDTLNRKLEGLYNGKQYSQLEILINLIYLYKF